MGRGRVGQVGCRDAELDWFPRGDGFVDYPLSLTGLILELRDQVVYVNDLVPVKDDRVRLSNLMAVY